MKSQLNLVLGMKNKYFFVIFSFLVFSCGEKSSSNFENSDSSSSSTDAISSQIGVSSSSIVSLNAQACGFSLSNNTLTCNEKVYKTVTIGSQILMAENLDIGSLVQGTSTTDNQIKDSIIEKYCYNNEGSMCINEGGLYQWSQAMNLPAYCNTSACVDQISTGHHQGICPIGWHIPKAAEWNQLATYLGGTLIAGSRMKLNNTLFDVWDSLTYNDGNSSGFSAIPAGNRYGEGGFYNRGNNAFFWEATEIHASLGAFVKLSSSLAYLYSYNEGKTYGFSVRCFKD
jgi:uncharacterized protein (TIGR02145 family)